MTRWLTTIACLLGLLALAAEARANMAKWWFEGERYGPLVPQEDSAVRVDSEDLAFTIAPSLDHASVVATYRMTNGGAAAASLDLAFVLVVDENAQSRGDRAALETHAAITLDGAHVPFRVVTDDDALAPALDAWLGAHPEVERELQRLAAPAMEVGHADVAELRRLVPACIGDCDELLRWYRQHDAAARKPFVRGAAQVAIPGDVARLQGGWSKLAERRPLAWLTFRVDVPAGATRTVMVSYDHRAGSDSSRAANVTFTYDYLLSPAKRWASFGPLHLSVRAPSEARVHASLPLGFEGGVYRADLPALPDGELSLAIMSTKGLLFGMTEPRGYWLLLLGAVVLVTLGLSIALGRMWRRTPTRGGLALRCIFGTGLVLGVANGAVMWLTGVVFPQHALGIGYGPLAGMLLMYAAAAIAGMMVSALSARARTA